MFGIELVQSGTTSGWYASIYSVSAAFVLSNVIAFTYEKSFRGLSYSRNFVQSLMLGSIVVCLAMQAIGNNLAFGLGMMGALAIIRFRTGLKDPRDMIFIFAGLAVGMATGVHAYEAAIIGTAGFCIAAFTLRDSGLGRNTYFDGIIRFNLPHGQEASSSIESVLSDSCQKFALVTLRDTTQGTRLDYSYQIKLKKSVSKHQLVESLKSISGIKGLHLMLQETTLEL